MKKRIKQQLSDYSEDQVLDLLTGPINEVIARLHGVKKKHGGRDREIVIHIVSTYDGAEAYFSIDRLETDAEEKKREADERVKLEKRIKKNAGLLERKKAQFDKLKKELEALGVQ